MAGYCNTEPMLEMFLFETSHLVEQLEQIVIGGDKSGTFSTDDINEIFRIMHTIKGSSAMMLFDNIATLAHSIEDVFFYLREDKQADYDSSQLSDLILAGIDFIKIELEKIKNDNKADGDVSDLHASIKDYLAGLKGSVQPAAADNGKNPPVRQQYYISQDKQPGCGAGRSFQAVVFFEDGCEMENIRSYTIIHSLKEMVGDLYYIPENIIEDDSTAAVIRQEGFQIFFTTDRPYQELQDFFNKTIFLKNFELAEAGGAEEAKPAVRPLEIVLEDQDVKTPSRTDKQLPKNSGSGGGHKSMISVNVAKLDKLMDLVGELVIAEAMVTQNPDLQGVVLDNFNKAARQLQKITDELQDTVMSVRMVPLATTFHKMHRVVRDMCKKLGKEIELTLVGEETEVDKNIIEQISDPIMHLIRNSIDHGIEDGPARTAAGKPSAGKITLEAKNAGSDVLILIRDDGRGLNKEKILQRAREHGLLQRPENELTDKEIYSFIFAPGFSTKDKVTEFSGRGVGMDVVTKNINSVGGAVLIDSYPGKGTTISLKIPLTLAIVNGMTVAVGDARYTLPINAVKESFRPLQNDIVIDPDGNEMIMVRGQCLPILRIHRAFKVRNAVGEFTDGIIIIVENDNETLCLFADRLIGEQQVVVKALPQYIKSIRQIQGLAGCTLLGDGSISLILDIGGMINTGYSP